MSRITRRSTFLQGTRVGTPLYLSPELVRQQPYDFKIDIWALGCVLHYLAALEPPFTGDSLAVLGENIVRRPPKQMPSIFSLALQHFVERLLTKNPADRPTTKEMLKLFPAFVKDEFSAAATKIREEKSAGSDAATASTTEGLFPRPPPSEPIPRPEQAVPQPTMPQRPCTVDTGMGMRWREDMPAKQRQQQRVCMEERPERVSGQDCLPIPASVWPQSVSQQNGEESGMSRSPHISQRNSLLGTTLSTNSRRIIICRNIVKRAITATQRSRPTLALLKNVEQCLPHRNLPSKYADTVLSLPEACRPTSAGADLMSLCPFAAPTPPPAAQPPLFSQCTLRKVVAVPQPTEDSRPHTAVQLRNFPMQTLPRIHDLQSPQQQQRKFFAVSIWYPCVSITNDSVSGELWRKMPEKMTLRSALGGSAIVDQAKLAGAFKTTVQHRRLTVTDL